MVYFISVESGSRIVADAADISPITGILSFDAGEMVRELSLTIHDDSIPELAEAFEVELSVISVDGEAAITGARVSNNSAAVVVVAASDEPRGVIRIADASTAIAIAEDVPAENPAVGMAQLQLERTFGSIGAVSVLWEVFPVADSDFPDYVDLLFFGAQGAEVGVAVPRPHTTTTALQFSGQPGSVVTVPSQYQPSNISAGFTIR